VALGEERTCRHLQGEQMQTTTLKESFGYAIYLVVPLCRLGISTNLLSVVVCITPPHLSTCVPLATLYFSSITSPAPPPPPPPFSRPTCSLHPCVGALQYHFRCPPTPDPSPSAQTPPSDSLNSHGVVLEIERKRFRSCLPLCADIARPA
jgi:hypothetical protein